MRRTLLHVTGFFCFAAACGLFAGAMASPALTPATMHATGCAVLLAICGALLTVGADHA